MTRVAILGAGDLGRQIAHLLELCGHEAAGFYDDTKPTGYTPPKNDVPVLGSLDKGSLDQMHSDHRSGKFEEVLIGVGYRHFDFREALRVACKERELELASVIAPGAVLDPSATVAPGCIVGPGCTLDQQVVLEDNVFLNPGCTLAHDSRVGADSMLGPGVVLSGAVNIGRRCFLGSATVVSDHITIADDAFTGAGTVVVHSIPAGERHVGVPSRALPA